MTNVRNRMANIIVSLDTSYAASARLSTLQSESEIRPVWQYEVPSGGTQSDDENDRATTRLLPNRGDFAVIYSSPKLDMKTRLSFILLQKVKGVNTC